MRLSTTSGSQWGPQHIVVDPSLAEVVVNLVKHFPKRDKVYHRNSTMVPLGFAEASAKLEFEVSVERTFIDIAVGSNDFPGPRTKSTTYANWRKGGNPRSKGPRGSD